jgi:hypothetical protein
MMNSNMTASAADSGGNTDGVEEEKYLDYCSFL